MKQNEIWVDNVKVLACVLVVLGHFFQSMVDNIIPINNFYLWFIRTIYYFHVPLFFICSGYLYQKYAKVTQVNSWMNNVVKKFINLGIPYFVFSIVTLILKLIFDAYVNNSVSSSFITSLLLHPISPYWYLYVLFFIFLVTPTFKTKKNMLCFLFIALTLSIFNRFVQGESFLPYPIYGILNNEVWFISGMGLAMFDWKRKVSFRFGIVGLVFLVLSILVQVFNISFPNLDLLLGILACISIISLMCWIYRDNKQNKIMNILSKYNLPIYLMHTIFAASFRSLLSKLGINSPYIHIPFGLIISFVGPIIAAIVLEKLKFINIIIYPSKYIKIKPVNIKGTLFN